jgi:hypothetical protein
MRRLDLGGSFEHITSVCVYEHIPVSGRIEVSSRIKELLPEGGTFSLTFDYRNPSARARISSPADVEEQIVRPSGLRVRGNPTFQDGGKRYLLHPFYHPRALWSGWKRKGVIDGDFPARDILRLKRKNDYTFGAVFLERGG